MRINRKTLSLLFAAMLCLSACYKQNDNTYYDFTSGETTGQGYENPPSVIETIPQVVSGISDDVPNSSPEGQQNYEIITIKPECGPSMGFSFGLPSGWRYECIMTEDDPTSRINVTLWSEDSSDTDGGYLRIEYSQSGYGICGTFLEEKSIDFNGCPASQGFYDGSEVWNFITLGGEYEGCAIFNELADYEKYSDSVDIILSTLKIKKYEGFGEG